jgi:hypothetical protein
MFTTILLQSDALRAEDGSRSAGFSLIAFLCAWWNFMDGCHDRQENSCEPRLCWILR